MPHAVGASPDGSRRYSRRLCLEVPAITRGTLAHRSVQKKNPEKVTVPTFLVRITRAGLVHRPGPLVRPDSSATSAGDRFEMRSGAPSTLHGNQNQQGRGASTVG